MTSAAGIAEVDEFAIVRQQLTEMLRLQEASVLYFLRAEVGPSDKAGVGSFFRTVEEREANSLATGSRLTTTITCLESLLEMPAWARSDQRAATPTLLAQLEEFVHRHLLTDDVAGVWKSDDAAWVYCRVRTLGSYLRLSESVGVDGHDAPPALRERVHEAWLSRYDGGASYGLREAARDVCTVEFQDAVQMEASDQQYPSNAYLTYWGLLARRGLVRAQVDLSDDGVIGERADKAAREWLVDNLARQVAFYFTRSALADAQQLLWSICGLVRFGDGTSLDNVRSSTHELLVAGLQAFFEQMQPNGDWAIGAPLFHYRNAGNAYSYIYEALGELFSIACAGPDQVPADAAAALRRELRRHWPRIRDMLSRALELGQRVKPEVMVWASGHHPHRSAESWATASVFRMLQSLRRLIGIWCVEETKQLLGARRPHHGIRELVERGDTWDTGNGSVGLYLRLAFLWSIEQTTSERSDEPAARLFCNDPDEPILAAKDQARSAILFGPPGTGKTTMVEALAGALGWDFIEITPAGFIDQGMDLVSARADHIFRQIMELDRCVVLLDEIDELIQLRGSESDPLERFFTTTMLPRLAALWERGKVLFFVNTNDIERVDTAIRRAQRFDAALLVLPPSYEAKIAYLHGDVMDSSFPLAKDAIEQTVIATDPTRNVSPPADELNVSVGWFALMRYDQLDTFKSVYRTMLDSGEQSPRGAAVEALRRIANELLRLDWLPTTKDGDVTPAKLPPLLGRLLSSVRRDGRRRLVWRTESADYETVPTGTENPVAWATQNGWTVDSTSGVLGHREVPSAAAD